MLHKRSAAALRLLALLLAVAALSCFFLTQKSGYHWDEGFTFALANGNGDWDYSTRSPARGDLQQFCREQIFTGGFEESVRNLFSAATDFLKNREASPWYQLYAEQYASNKSAPAWVDAKALYESQVPVNDPNPFSRLLTLYANQASDNHPPLHYLCLSAVFSLFPGTYSDWYAFAVNLVFLLAACVLVYRLVLRNFGGEMLALAAVAVYGLSCGFVSAAVFFRMYAVMTFFVVWLLSAHLRLMSEGWRASRGTAVQLVLANVLGFYTHYYFILYSAGLALFVLTVMLLKKRFGSAGRYLLLMLLAVVFSLLIWPVSVYHLLFSHRGTEAFANLSAGWFLRRIVNYMDVVSAAFFGGYKKLAFAVVVAFIASAVVLLLRHRKDASVERAAVCAGAGKWLMLLFPAGLYFVIVSQVAPYQDERYIFCLYPTIAIVLAAMLFCMARMLRSKRVQAVVLAVLIAGLSAFGFATVGPSNLFRGYEPLNECTDVFEEGPVNCIVYGYNVAHFFRELPLFDQIIWMHDSTWDPFDIFNYSHVLYLEKPANPDAPVVLMIAPELMPDSIIAEVSECMGKTAENAELIRVCDYARTYLLR